MNSHKNQEVEDNNATTNFEFPTDFFAEAELLRNDKGIPFFDDISFTNDLHACYEELIVQEDAEKKRICCGVCLSEMKYDFGKNDYIYNIRFPKPVQGGISLTRVNICSILCLKFYLLFIVEYFWYNGVTCRVPTPYSGIENRQSNGW